MSAADARTRLLAPGTIRGIALLLCATGIVGMIVTSIADNVDAAIAFGFVGATGALALLLVGVLVPAVEAASGLVCGTDFFLGYSPERINPGDREPIHAVFVGGSTMPVRVRLFVDFLVELHRTVTEGGSVLD